MDYDGFIAAQFARANAAAFIVGYVSGLLRDGGIDPVHVPKLREALETYDRHDRAAREALGKAAA